MNRHISLLIKYVTLKTMVLQLEFKKFSSAVKDFKPYGCFYDHQWRPSVRTQLGVVSNINKDKLSISSARDGKKEYKAREMVRNREKGNREFCCTWYFIRLSVKRCIMRIRPKCSQIISKYMKTTFDVKYVNARDVPKNKRKFTFNKIFCSKLHFWIKGQNVKWKFLNMPWRYLS